MAQGVAGGTLHATTSCADALAGADMSLICVGTPSTARGGTDLTYVRGRWPTWWPPCAQADPPASGQHSVVIRSTVPPGTVEDVVLPALAEGLAGTGHRGGRGDVPGVPPRGLRDRGLLRTRRSWSSAPPTRPSRRRSAACSASWTSPPKVVDTRTAEALKYTCNAFHATKVSFANEVSRLFRLMGVDSREVMSLFCEDTILNISPSYLRPGFAFGGSCLPKDLRSLLHLARVNGADLPLLAGTLATNEIVINEVVDRVVAHDARSVALLGLSFKMNTDDLRESPNVELAERLLGKGFDVRIYDPIVNPARLVGANRRHVESKLPAPGPPAAP